MLLFAVAVSAVAADSAQSYPNRPIRLVVPFAAGGNADIVGRVIANKLAQRLGQNIVVDNRVSASSIIGTDMVAKSPPDGYTLLLIALTHVTNPGFVGKLPYDSKKDFAPISLVASTPLMMMSYPGFPVKTVKDVIAMAKVRPGTLWNPFWAHCRRSAGRGGVVGCCSRRCSPSCSPTPAG